MTFAGAVLLSLAVAAPEFERDVAPILIRRCLECHQSTEPSGGLVLAHAAGLRNGGESGSVLGPDAPASYLYQRIADGEMPPEQRGVSQRLPADELQILRDWIDAGAAWPADRQLDLYEQTTDVRAAGRDWWSLQPVQRPAVPMIPSTSHPIDAFVRDRLAEATMRPAPAADRPTLLRRLKVDLHGLPPTVDEIEAFVADRDPLAWERLVDRLLAAPQFGERWARHWLDVVRFAETSGYERDQVKSFAWKYRDWIVRSFNADLPFDQFVRAQIAGDELPERSLETVIATGFLRLGTWNDEPNDPQDYKYDRLEDLVNVTSTAFLGLTVKCARCHDHKFDPIPQEDYYRVAAVFWPGPVEARDRELLGGPSGEELGVTDVLGWTDITVSPLPLRLLKNGERQHPMQVIDPATPSFLPAEHHRILPPDSAAKTTQRRLQLANWIAHPQNPLAARVIVNRLWLHHFGAGLVRTPNNFGFTGQPSTHPDLLDWLADELIRSGWSLKHIHRLIVTSETYRQSSIHPSAAVYRERDAANTLWWRAERRRLDAESLRDALLAVAGQLDLQTGGPSFRPTINPAALEGLSRKGAAWTASPPRDQQRRSLYSFTQRSLLPPMMTTFDLCDTTLPCGQRESTTVVPQSLALLNNDFVHQRAQDLARDVLAAGVDAELAARRIWQAILTREPTPDEKRIALAHVARQRQRFQQGDFETVSFDPRLHAWASLCIVLFNSNEFLYVD